MYRQSDIKIDQNQAITPLSHNKQNIVNPISTVAYASETTRDYAPHVQETKTAFFRRDCAQSAEWISKILFYCDLKSLLALRLASKGFFDLVSIIKTDNLFTLLSNKAVVVFKDGNINNLAAQKAFIFANENNIESDFIISLNELFDPASIFNSISGNTLRAILKIKNCDQVNLLQSLIADQKEINYLGQIKGLDFELTINNETISSVSLLLTTIAQNQNYFPYLTMLNFGLIDDTFELPLALNNINNINIRAIWNTSEVVDLKFLEAFSGLQSLSLETIRCSGILNLSYAVPNLTNLTIGDTHEKTILKLPALLPNLSNLVIENDRLIHFFPKKMHNLTTLTIRNISRDTSKLDLLKSFNWLTTLTIGRIQDKNNFELFLPPSLTKFVIETQFSSNFSFLSPLPNLISLSIGVDYNSMFKIFKLPDELYKLNNLAICARHAILVLPTILYPFKYFTIDTSDINDTPYGITQNDKIQQLVDEINKRINPLNSIGSILLSAIGY